MRAVAYHRISLDRTGEGEGVSEQAEDLRRLAERHGATITLALTDNDRSASRGARPGWDRLVEAIRGGEVDAVLAVAVDRLYRRPRDLEDLVDAIESGPTPVVILTVRAGELDLNTASGRMVARLLGAVARQESDAMGERQRRSLLGEAERGTPPRGVPPYAYRRSDDGLALVVDEGEAEVVRRIFAMLSDDIAPHTVARRLTAEGIAGPGGGFWHPTTIQRMVAHPIYLGLRKHGELVLGPSGWEAIVGERTHATAVATLARYRQAKKPRSLYPYSGLLFCGVCEGRLSGSAGKGGTYRRYDCRSGHNSIKESIAHEGLRRFAVTTALPALQSIVESYEPPPLAEGLSADEVAQRRRGAALAYARGQITVEQLVAVGNELDATRPAPAPDADALWRALDDAERWWATADGKRRRRLLSAVVERVVVAKVCRGSQAREARLSFVMREAGEARGLVLGEWL